MRVLLINPISQQGELVIRTGRCQIKCLPGIGVYPPIDLAYIATSLQKDYRIVVNIHDGAISGEYSSILAKIIDYKPELVIMNCTTPTLKEDQKLAEDIKQINSNIIIAVFGLHASVQPEDVFLCNGLRTNVDCILQNEFEITAFELCQAMMNNQGIDKVKGITYCDNDGHIYKSLREENTNLDVLGFPDRGLIDNHYYKLQYNNEPYTIIQTSRGCANSCIYCTATVLENKKIAQRSVDSVIEEIKCIINNYGIKNVMFLSDTFTASKKWVKELCQKIIENKIDLKWMANSRVDKIDLETAQLMKRAGCWIVSLGIESANDDILKRAKKNTTVAQINDALQIFKKAKIKTIGYFMFGLPGESQTTIKNTIRFARKSSVDFGYFYIATPYPGTEFYKLAVANKWLKSKDWSRYFNGDADVIEYPNLSSHDMKLAVKQAYFWFYFNPIRIINRLTEIRSTFLLKKYIEIATSIIKRIFGK